jgi:Holliday junction resolvase RusA-like endonuclease
MVIFHMPMPQSWNATHKRRMLGQPHQQTPDCDNLLKSLADSLLPAGDAAIWFTVAAKFWATEGAIEIVNLTEAEARYILVRKDVTKIDN